MTDAELVAISRAVIDEWQVGGFADDIYEEFAIEVAKRAIALEREACAKLADEQAKRDHMGFAGRVAAAIRARGKDATEPNPSE